MFSEAADTLIYTQNIRKSTTFGNTGPIILALPHQKLAMLLLVLLQTA